ncbi:hypothetical protein L204_104244 [Cryptococcus depauperatus]
MTNLPTRASPTLTNSSTTSASGNPSAILTPISSTSTVLSGLSTKTLAKKFGDGWKSSNIVLSRAADAIDGKSAVDTSYSAFSESQSYTPNDPSCMPDTLHGKHCARVPLRETMVSSLEPNWGFDPLCAPATYTIPMVNPERDGPLFLRPLDANTTQRDSGGCSIPNHRKTGLRMPSSLTRRRYTSDPNASGRNNLVVRFNLDGEVGVTSNGFKCKDLEETPILADGRSILINRVDERLTEDVLRQNATRFGEVIDVIIQANAPCPNAFVMYKHVKDAQKFMHSLKNQSVQCEFVKDNYFVDPPVQGNPAPVTLYIEGLSTFVTYRQLKQLLMPANVVSWRPLVDMQGARKGPILVGLATRAQAEEIIKRLAKICLPGLTSGRLQVRFTDSDEHIKMRRPSQSEGRLPGDVNADENGQKSAQLLANHLKLCEEYQSYSHQPIRQQPIKKQFSHSQLQSLQYSIQPNSRLQSSISPPCSFPSPSNINTPLNDEKYYVVSPTVNNYKPSDISTLRERKCS